MSCRARNPLLHPVVPWQKIHSVFLDMDGTLLDLAFDNHFWHNHVPYCFACKHDMDMESARDVVFPKYRGAEGTLDWYCVDYWTRTLGLDIVKLKQQEAHRIQMRPGAAVFLDWLRAGGYSLHLVTNAHRETLDIKLQRTGIAACFDVVSSSHDFGAPKEDPAFWAQYRQRHPFEPGSTLFIDDSVAVLRAARDFGIRYLFSIAQPDSRKPERDTDEFPMLRDFSALIGPPRALAG